MTYEELNMKYQALLSEVVHLRKENSELKKRLGIPNPEETTGDAERAAE